MKYVYFYTTEIGKIKITATDGYIIALNVTDSYELDSDEVLEEIDLIKETAEAIMEYMVGNRKEFKEIPLKLRGTDFQMKVWNELKNIPYGETRSYKEIAERIGNPKGYRAVGMANNKNPIGIIVPCHRVIGKNGDLVGYAGGVKVKEQLLEIERKKRDRG